MLVGRFWKAGSKTQESVSVALGNGSKEIRGAKVRWSRRRDQIPFNKSFLGLWPIETDLCALCLSVVQISFTAQLIPRIRAAFEAQRSQRVFDLISVKEIKRQEKGL
jgi:hypothetical protein